MKVSLEKEGSNVMKLGVELEPDRAKKAYEKACRQLSHRVKIPGFRPGKAPRAIVEKTVGVDYIKREALEQLVPEILGQVISDEKLDVITEPQIESWDFNLGEPLKLNATFEVRPEVQLGDYKGISVKVGQTALEDDAMDKALASIAEAKASLQPLTDKRPVEMGQTVLMDFECLVNGELVEGGKAEGLLLEMKSGNFLDGFCEQLEGKEVDAKVDVKATFPDQYRNPELAGKDALFKVHIREIRQKFIPDINDELAKTVGKDSLDDLKEALKQRLSEEIDQENEARTQRAVVDEVVKCATVDIPETMILRECNLLLAHLQRYVEQAGQSWESFVKSPEYAEVYKQKRDEAQTRVLTSLVLGAVVRSENMSIADQEAAPYLAELISRYNVPIEQVAHNEELKRALQELRRQAMEEALTRKVVDFLISNAKLEFHKEEKAAEAVAT